MNTEMNIYVADLSAYNAGHLHGAWIDATLELDDIQEQVNEMLKASPIQDAEEWAIHDYDGFQGSEVYEHEGLESVHDKALFIEEYGQIGAYLLAHLADNYDEARNDMEDIYCDDYNSIEDYARELTTSSTEIPEHLESYIDYERMGKDMEMSGDIYTITTAHDEVHIFGAC
jgi:antirestriction protein